MKKRYSVAASYATRCANLNFVFPVAIFVFAGNGRGEQRRDPKFTLGPRLPPPNCQAHCRKILVNAAAATLAFTLSSLNFDRLFWEKVSAEGPPVSGVDSNASGDWMIF